MANSPSHVKPERRKPYSGTIHAGDIFTTSVFVWDYDGKVFTSRSYGNDSQPFTGRFNEKQLRLFWARANPCGQRLVGPLEKIV